MFSLLLEMLLCPIRNKEPTSATVNIKIEMKSVMEMWSEKPSKGNTSLANNSCDFLSNFFCFIISSVLIWAHKKVFCSGFGNNTNFNSLFWYCLRVQWIYKMAKEFKRLCSHSLILSKWSTNEHVQNKTISKNQRQIRTL